MSEPILYDPRTDGRPVIWHKDPNCENLVKHIIETLKPDRFVETGTHMGWTDMWMAQHYPSLPIFTVEIDNQYYSIAVHNCKPYPNIKVYHMSSPHFLRLIYDELKKGLTFFYLDAHWWQYVPLRDECKIIVTLDKYVILVDDFACNNPRFGGDTFGGDASHPGIENNIEYLADILGKRHYRPNYEALPPYYKGYGLFIKGVDYTPPKTMREEGIE